MRNLELNEEEYKSLKEYIYRTKGVYKDHFFDEKKINGRKVSFENYNRMEKVLDKIDRLKKVRVRYDKTETNQFWIEEIKKLFREKQCL